MRITILVISLLLQFGIASGQKGIIFDTSFTSWSEVLQEARKIDKPIFVDLYTSWCGPCKHMDRSIFSQKEVGEYYNTYYLCIKLNAEKGYGVTFNNKNNIGEYPSFLFFSPTGETIRIEAGFRQVPSFLALGRAAMKEYKTGNNLQTMEDKIKSGKYNLAFLVTYIKELGNVKKTNILVFEKYLSCLPVDSLYSDGTTMFVETYYLGWIASNSLGLDVMLHAYKKYPIKDWELMKPWSIINGRLKNDIDIAIKKKDSLGMEDIIKAYHKFDTEPDNFRMDKEYVYCSYFAGIGDSPNFIKYLKLYIKDNIINEEEGMQQQQELKRYRAALKFKFRVDNDKLLPPKDKWFSKSYINNYDLILMQLKGLQYYYNNYLKKNSTCDRIFSDAIQIALRNYEKYSPNYNKFLIPFYAEKKLE